jgi:hypothetical protein
MNCNFSNEIPRHKNLVAKLRNSVTDLNFYAFRFLERDGIPSSPKTGLKDAQFLVDCGRKACPELLWILERYQIVLQATPDTANDIFYSTWTFVHEFDELFKL